MVLSLTLFSPVSSSSLIQTQKLRYHPLGWWRYSYTPSSDFLMSEHKFKQRKTRTYFSSFPQCFFPQSTSSSFSLIDCHHLSCLQICNIWLTQCGISLDLQKKIMTACQVLYLSSKILFLHPLIQLMIQILISQLFYCNILCHLPLQACLSKKWHF